MSNRGALIALALMLLASKEPEEVKRGEEILEELEMPEEIPLRVDEIVKGVGTFQFSAIPLGKNLYALYPSAPNKHYIVDATEANFIFQRPVKLISINAMQTDNSNVIAETACVIHFAHKYWLDIDAPIWSYDSVGDSGWYETFGEDYILLPRQHEIKYDGTANYRFWFILVVEVLK